MIHVINPLDLFWSKLKEITVSYKKMFSGKIPNNRDGSKKLSYVGELYSLGETIPEKLPHKNLFKI